MSKSNNWWGATILVGIYALGELSQVLGGIVNVRAWVRLFPWMPGWLSISLLVVGLAVFAGGMVSVVDWLKDRHSKRAKGKRKTNRKKQKPAQREVKSGGASNAMGPRPKSRRGAPAMSTKQPGKSRRKL